MLATEQGRNIISNGLIEIKKNMAVKGEQRSLEDTPTWAVSVCSFFVLIVSLIIEAGLHKLTEVIKLIIVK